MARPTLQGARTHRRGAIAILAALMLVFLLGMIAFAVDIGYIALVRAQLQTAADSAALAGAAAMSRSAEEVPTTASTFAGYHSAGGRGVNLNSNDVQIGSWDTDAKTFTPATGLGNAVKVTVRMDDSTGGEAALFFARLFGKSSVADSAWSVATMNPRDICFVVDVSGSMNDDTTPSETSNLNSTYAAQGYPTIGSDLLNQVYSDFGYACMYGTEVSQYIGQGLSGVSKQSSRSSTLALIASTSGPLASSSILDPYHIYSADGYTTSSVDTSLTVAQYKAYRWIIDVQIPTVMPAAKPTPNSGNLANYKYWKNYVDSYWSKLGYRNYVEFMMYNGRTGQPGSSGIYTPLSIYSDDCPKHVETTAGGNFSFPPREMPTHAGRLAIISAINLIKTRNQGIADTNQRDWVSIISYDRNTGGSAPILLKSLDSNFDGAMSACANLQACDDFSACTATETGLIAARNLLKPASEGGSGRPFTNKIVVVLTDGIPNLKTSSNTTISTYRTANPSTNFYGGTSYYNYDAALMQTSTMHGDKWYLYPVGIGLGCDYGFMDRLGRMGATADSDGLSPRGSGNPAEYTSVLTSIFQNIISHPKLRLVYTSDMHF